MELRQMSRIHRLIPEHPINTEQLRRSEPIILCSLSLSMGLCGTRVRPQAIIVDLLAPTFGRKFIEHVGRGCGGVCSEEESVGFCV